MKYIFRICIVYFLLHASQTLTGLLFNNQNNALPYEQTDPYLRLIFGECLKAIKAEDFTNLRSIFITQINIFSEASYSKFLKKLLNHQDTNGYTLLMHATEIPKSQNTNNKNAIILELLKLGSNPNLKNNKGEAAFFILLNLDDIDACMIFFQHADARESNPLYIPLDLYIKNQRGNTIFLEAIALKRSEVIEECITRNLHKSMYNQNANGDTSLILATRVDDVKRVEILLNNVSRFIQNNNNESALMIAVQRNKKDIINLLIGNAEKEFSENYDRQMFLNLKNKYGQTALIIATENNFDQTVTTLLENQADINIQDASGDTALMIAIKNNHEKIIDLLLNDPNLNIFLRNIQGKTALTLAQGLGKFDLIIKLLKTTKIKISSIEFNQLITENNIIPLAFYIFNDVLLDSMITQQIQNLKQPDVINFLTKLNILTKNKKNDDEKIERAILNILPSNPNPTDLAINNAVNFIKKYKNKKHISGQETNMFEDWLMLNINKIYEEYKRINTLAQKALHTIKENWSTIKSITDTAKLASLTPPI